MSAGARAPWRAHAVGLAAAAVLALAACSAPAGTADPTGPAGATAATTPAASLTVSDAWVKAADAGMTAAFGVLHNGTDADIEVTGASSPASPDVQLHETVATDGGMSMRQVASFVVPAHGSFVLEPGGNHVMFMDLPAPIRPGDEVTVTLMLTGGGSLEFTAPAKDFSGANESYDGHH